MKNGLRFTILLVDDDPDDRIIIDEAFGQIGFQPEVKKFIDGDAMMNYLEQVEPDLLPSLIVLDNTLPKKSAADMLQLLKKDARFHTIPVVVYTTSLSPAKNKQLMEMGAFECFEKGSTMREVVALATRLKELSLANNDTAHKAN